MKNQKMHRFSYTTIDHKEKNTPYIYLSFPNKNRKNYGITQGSVAYT